MSGNGGVPAAGGPPLRASWHPWPLTGCIRPGTHLPGVSPAPFPRSFPDAGYEFDICFTSVQKRAIRTLWTVLDAIDQMWLPVIRTWRLNERHYGALTGLNKAETAAKHGEAQVKIWRRSYDIPPPPMQSDHPFYSTISKVRPIGLHLPCWEAPKTHLRSLRCGLDSSARSSLSPLQQLGLLYMVLAGVGLSLSHFLLREAEPMGIAQIDAKWKG